MSTTDTALYFDDLSIAYTATGAILKNITLGPLVPGDVLSLIGRNGAGKTSLARALLGLVPYGGRITYGTENLARLHRRRRAALMGYVSQNYRIEAHITALEALLLCLRIQSTSLHVPPADLERAFTALETMGLAARAHAFCPTLSGGESQLLSVAQALLGRPQILVLDEPNAALDISRKIELLDYIYRYAKQHAIIVIIILHDLNLAMRYSDKTAILDQGRLVRTGASAEVLTPEVLETVFHIRAEILRHKGRSYILPTEALPDGVPLKTPQREILSLQAS